MSTPPDPTIPPIPQLRPYARQGKAYWDEAKAIIKQIKYDLKWDAETIKHRRNGAMRTRDLFELALRYELNPKLTCEALEDMGVLRVGTYDKIRDSNLRIKASLQEVWEMMHREA